MKIVVDNFCHHPWSSIHVSPQGELKPCCKYDQSFGSNLVQYRQSQQLAQLKQQFLDGSKPSGCYRCWDDESAGLPSKRTIDNVYTFGDIPIPSENFVLLDIALDNACNLACATCSSFSSTRWLADETHLASHDIKVKRFPLSKHLENDQFKQDLLALLPTIEHLYVGGGEPFLPNNKKQLELLDYLLLHKNNDCRLTYITNATCFPSEDFWLRWKHFKKITILLSVDAIKDKFEYIRWPASWSQCYDNIKTYQQYQSQMPNMQISISHTVSVLNVLYLPSFFIWCLKESLPWPYLGPAAFPQHLNIQNLPLEVKKYISDRLLGKKFLPIVEYMNHQTPNNLRDFFRITELLDQRRQHRFQDVFPELRDILDPYRP